MSKLCCSLLLSVRRVMDACWMTVVVSTTMPSLRRNSCKHSMAPPAAEASLSQQQEHNQQDSSTYLQATTVAHTPATYTCCTSCMLTCTTTQNCGRMQLLALILPICLP